MHECVSEILIVAHVNEHRQYRQWQYIKPLFQLKPMCKKQSIVKMPPLHFAYMWKEKKKTQNIWYGQVKCYKSLLLCGVQKIWDHFPNWISYCVHTECVSEFSLGKHPPSIQHESRINFVLLHSASIVKLTWSILNKTNSLFKIVWPSVYSSSDWPHLFQMLLHYPSSTFDGAYWGTLLETC